MTGHASLGARWSARALASADSLRSARHVWMFAVVCVTEQLVAIASADCCAGTAHQLSIGPVRDRLKVYRRRCFAPAPYAQKHLPSRVPIPAMPDSCAGQTPKVKPLSVFRFALSVFRSETGPPGVPVTPGCSGAFVPPLGVPVFFGPPDVPVQPCSGRGAASPPFCGLRASPERTISA